MKKIIAAVMMALLISVAGCGKPSGQENGTAADQGKVVTVITVQKQSEPVALTAMAVAEAKQDAHLSFSASGNHYGVICD